MNMTKAQLLEEVKTALGYTGTYHDGSLGVYIDEIKQYLASIDVPTAVLNSDAVVGIVTMGVDSLRETGGLSDYFKQRAIQLRLTPGDEPTEIPDAPKLTKVCGITENANLSPEFAFFEPEESGIFEYGPDRHFIIVRLYLKASNDLSQNTQIRVANIDDRKYWPIVDQYMIGYCSGDSDVMSGMVRIWTYGAITILTPRAIAKGEYFSVEISGEYTGVK